ncbi:MAG: M20/M25/M40 family metallo-hydrolase [Rhodospirillales bacterium]|nr:M20/M25/M40 family metallo-hydrolase [Rhodospirillales bacterium]
MNENLHLKIRENLVACRADQFQFLSDLIKTPSEISPGDMEPVVGLTVKALKEMGFGVERHEVPSDLAAGSGLSNLTNLVVRHEFAAGPIVALAAHGDTRKATAGWTQDPFGAVIKNGTLYGLGAISKADLAVYAHALVALRDARPDLSGTVELHFTFDCAQDGELGPGWLLKNGIVNPDYALGSGCSYGIGTSAMGDLQLQVEITGTALSTAQAATRAAGGVVADALEAAVGVMAALYKARDDIAKIRSDIPGIGSPSLVIGEIEGGERPDEAPGKVVFGLGRDLIPNETPAAVEAGLIRLIADAASQFDGVVCKISRVKLSPPMKAGPATDKLSGILEGRAADVMGGPVWVYGVPYDPGSRHYAALGIPTVLYGAGPGTLEEAHAGGPDERLVLDDLRKATEVTALALADFLKPAA